MTDLIDKFYMGSNAIDYDNKRTSSDKWKFENQTAISYLEEFPPSTSLTVLDAPVGTCRFIELYNTNSKIVSVTGLDYSSDMLDVASTKGCSKLHLQQHDLINDKVTGRYDIILCYRLLNLIPLTEAIQVLKNVLPCVEIGGLITVRTINSSTPLHLGDRKYLQPINDIKQTFFQLGFTIRRVHLFVDKANGNYHIFDISRDV